MSGGELEAEARVLARCLVDGAPPPELAARYAEACRTLLPEAPTPREARLLAFVRRRPWSAPFLDAACGLVAPRGRLRSKVLILAAVLEASREYADTFLPPESAPPSAPALLLRLGGLGLLGTARTLVGLALYPIATRA